MELIERIPEEHEAAFERMALSYGENCVFLYQLYDAIMRDRAELQDENTGEGREFL